MSDAGRPEEPDTGSAISVLTPAAPVLALNFVSRGLLGDRIAASTRSDPPATSLGEYLRARVLAIPEEVRLPLADA